MPFCAASRASEVAPMDNTSVGSDGPGENDSGIESSSTSGASCDNVAYIRVAVPDLDVQVSNSYL